MLSTATVILGGIPAALYERFIGAKDDSTVDLALDLAGRHRHPDHPGDRQFPENRALTGANRPQFLTSAVCRGRYDVFLPLSGTSLTSAAFRLGPAGVLRHGVCIPLAGRSIWEESSRSRCPSAKETAWIHLRALRSSRLPATPAFAALRRRNPDDRLQLRSAARPGPRRLRRHVLHRRHAGPGAVSDRRPGGFDRALAGDGAGGAPDRRRRRRAMPATGSRPCCSAPPRPPPESPRSCSAWASCCHGRDAR